MKKHFFEKTLIKNGASIGANATVVPGVIIVEALAQTAGVVAGIQFIKENRSVLFMSINSVKFRKPVKPNENISFFVEKINQVKNAYKFSGKAPLVLKKEIPGFVATRLQEALWREALHMVANGEASVEDIDAALINGPAPRMVVQGQCMAFHVACGEGGMATNLDQFGPALKLPWTRLKAPELSKELRNRMVDGCNEMAGEEHFETLVSNRDDAIVRVLNALKNKS